MALRRLVTDCVVAQRRVTNAHQSVWKTLSRRSGGMVRTVVEPIVADQQAVLQRHRLMTLFHGVLISLWASSNAE